jgi:H2-forming N5,N10-methylenetetrahydromethanopterin dehydrogenase-like enzyme
MVDSMSGQPETVVSWRAISAHCPVVTSDGVEVGHVADVAGLPEEDIFHGVVFTHRALGHHVLAPADDIDRITGLNGAPLGKHVYLLNCQPVGSIAARASVTFAMVLDVPSSAAAGRYTLLWSPLEMGNPKNVQRVPIEITH